MLKSYPYQEDIINKTVMSRDNTLIMLPTGGGKTHIASVVADRTRKTHGKVLFLAPKLNLLNQTIDSFSALNPQKIHGSSSFDEKGDVFVSTIQTMSRRPEMLEKMDFDTIIIDEVHFGDNGKMQEVIKTSHSGKIVGLSATPYDSTGKLLSGYKTIIDDYDMNYLIKKKFLTPVEALCPFSVDLKGIKITAGEYNIKELDYRMSSAKMIAMTVDATADIIKTKNKTIIFCVSIEHAEKITKAYRKIFKAKKINKKIKTLHSKVDDSLRDQILDDFSNPNGKIDILISVDMITTGFNAPPTDCMVIARPTRSQNLYKQMVGRGTRNFPGKKYCLMIDCGNVVENLGMPLDPIRIIEKKKTEVDEVRSCSCCGSYKTRVLQEDGYGGLLKVCPVCGGDEEEYLGENIDSCRRCNFMHTYSSHEKNYIINKFGIALKCKGCKAITPLSFFRPPREDKAYSAIEFTIDESIARHIINEKTIFFKPYFVKYAALAVKKKEISYINLIFSKKENLDKKVFDKLKKEMDRENYDKDTKSLPIGILRILYVTFCHKKLGEEENDLMMRILKTEELYKNKYNRPMPSIMYKNSAIHYVNYVINKNTNKKETVPVEKHKKNQLGKQQKFQFE